MRESALPARDRLRLERLLRYGLRPPLSTERLSLLPDGRLLYKLKRRWSDGTTHVIYEPMELMERLAALVPPPRFNITRFYGVLAPAATFRPFIVPEDKTSIAPTHSGCPARVDTSKTDARETKAKRGKKPKNYSWAQLMMRVFEFDVLCLSPLWRKDENLVRNKFAAGDSEDSGLSGTSYESSAHSACQA